jgi:uridine phosphorylase
MPDHLGITSTDCRVAIITGNPERVPAISRHFDDHREISIARGFVCHEALLNRTPLLIVSAGIGAPSTAIVIEELIDLGVKTIIRLGTCGALQPHIKVCDLVISTGCVREEGTSLQYVDAIFPAIPNHLVLQELIASASRQASRFHAGITHCKDAYYSERPAKQLDQQRAGARWEMWERAGVLATEMETSVLFVLGSLRAIQTGAVFVNVGQLTDPALFNRALEDAVKIIRQTLSTLADKGLLTTKAHNPVEDLSYLTKD